MVGVQLEQRKIKGYGWKPSLPSPHDVVADHSELAILKEVDPRKDMTPIYNQGDEGSCTSNTVSEALDYDRQLDGEDAVTPSRHGIYLGERRVEGSPLDQDTGAYGRDGFKVASTTGYWAEKDWPYLKSADQQPTDCKYFYTDMAKQLGDAPYKLTKPYKTVARTQAAFQAILSNKQTIAIGFTVYESFESDEVAKTGIMPVPGPDEQVLGGHEVLVVGYLQSEPHYALVRNHWGAKSDGSPWGIDGDGYFFMPWSVLMDSSMSSDFRTIYRPAGQ